MNALPPYVFDIEGTIGSIAFVREVLFPYAAQHLPDYVSKNSEALHELLAEVPGSELEAKIATLQQMIADDVKHTALKTLQGLVWEAGYKNGILQGHIYADAAQAMRAYHRAGHRLYIYSSGSVAAQKLLLHYSVEGDLTALITDYFDTNIGFKNDPEAYRRISAAIGHAAPVFFSDALPELQAAQQAGWRCVLLDRERTATEPGFPVLHAFTND